MCEVSDLEMKHEQVQAFDKLVYSQLWVVVVFTSPGVPCLTLMRPPVSSVYFTTCLYKTAKKEIRCYTYGKKDGENINCTDAIFSPEDNKPTKTSE